MNFYSITLMIDPAIVQSGAPLAKVTQGVKNSPIILLKGTQWLLLEVQTIWNGVELGEH